MTERRFSRSRAARVGLALVGLAVLFTGVAVSMAAGPTGYSFTGAPSAPLASAGPASSVLSDFDVQVHSRDTSTWYQLESMQAQHGSDCGAPPATHENHTYEGAVFQCKDHLMTAIKAGGYGVIYLTPPQMVDFSATPASISWEQSTLRMSSRDFTSVWITPWEDNIALPFDTGQVDLQGVPRNGVHIQMDSFNGGTIYRAYLTSNFQTTEIPGTWWATQDDALAAAGRAPSASLRESFQITISNNHLKFGIPALNYFPIDAAIPGLPFTQAIVQFGQHSYNPEKDGAGVAATWHWDNFAISPAVPFTIVKADRRYLDSPAQTLTFNAPAPANAMLRFSSVGTTEVSFDGAPFQPAQKAQSSSLFDGTYHPEHASNFWTPVPLGARTVRVRWSADGWYQGPYIAQDFAFWSRSAGSAPSSIAKATPITTTATSTSRATPTTTVATVTPTATPKTPPVPPTPTPKTPPVPPSPTQTNLAPTIPPTATPTTAPPPAAPPTAATLRTTASVSSKSPKAGIRLLLTASVTSSTNLSALVDVEVYSPSGQKVYQNVYDNRNFTSGAARTFSSYWSIPKSAAKGTYTVKIGVFKVGWAGLLSWTDSATNFTVK